MEPHEKVHVGDMVHYVVDNTTGDNQHRDESDRHPHRCLAATVTALTDMELIGQDGTSYADHPLPQGPKPPLATRWYVSLAVLHTDASTAAVHDVPGPYRATPGRWHKAPDCGVQHWPDWNTPDERAAIAQHGYDSPNET